MSYPETLISRFSHLHLGSVSEKSGAKSNIKPPPPPETLILDYHTFDEVALVSLSQVDDTMTWEADDAV